MLQRFPLPALILASTIAASSSPARAQAVDWQDPVAMAEALTALFDGRYPYPQYAPTICASEDAECVSFVPDVPKDDGFCQRQQRSGYFANTLAQCQAYYACDKVEGTQNLYVCPNMTVFSQYYLTCMWAPAVDCSQAEQLFSLDAVQATTVPDAWGTPFVAP